MTRLAWVAAGLLLVGPAPAVAQQGAVVAYQRAVAKVCETKITPDLVRLYQDAQRELDAARSGQGQDSNFFGLRSPERAYNDCFQGTGVVPR